MIPFNRPYLSGIEKFYIEQVCSSGKLSGDGMFTQKCHEFFEKKYNFKKCLLTTSCTSALEMAAILLDIQPGDEVIIPSYTFVSTANAFLLRGATIIFSDSGSENPCIDATNLESLITSKTKAIVPVHYAGVACDMHHIMQLADKYNLFVVEDAAQAIDSYYTFPDGTIKPLGGIGHLGAMSFHDTKNIICGEGGMLIINDPQFLKRAEIIREKGTNRSLFFRGEIDKYGWVDIGSSYLSSDILAAFLWGQLQCLEKIQAKRKNIWNYYHNKLVKFQNPYFSLPRIPVYAVNNAHMFYIVFRNKDLRSRAIEFLKQKGVHTTFHYVSLHNSQYFENKHAGQPLPESEKYTDCLLRLPLYYDLTYEQIDMVCEQLISFCENELQTMPSTAIKKREQMLLYKEIELTEKLFLRQ